MVGEINFFDSIEHLAPKCPGCGIALEYGLNTKFNDTHSSHACLKCGTAVK